MHLPHRAADDFHVAASRHRYKIHVEAEMSLCPTRNLTACVAKGFSFLLPLHTALFLMSSVGRAMSMSVMLTLGMGVRGSCDYAVPFAYLSEWGHSQIDLQLRLQLDALWELASCVLCV